MKTYAMFLLLLIASAGCKSTEDSGVNSGTAATPTPGAVANPSNTTAPAAVKAKVDVCNLLTSEELKSVQGEAYKEAQRSDRQEGDFLVAQCYYQMPTMTNSVVLNVTSATDRPGARDPKEFWQQTFRGAEEKGREPKTRTDKEKDNAKPRREGEEEEGAAPEPIKGLGDEAFWSASRVGGALFVLKKDQFFRISVGGAGDAQTKLNKSKTLAQQVLKKL